jgi:hypothetical protein
LTKGHDVSPEFGAPAMTQQNGAMAAFGIDGGRIRNPDQANARAATVPADLNLHF